MSLVPTYVEDQSGRWYRNPVIRRRDWFICWDDNEPIELVVARNGPSIPSILAMLLSIGWRVRTLGFPERSGSRLFQVLDHNDVKPRGEYRPANRVFLAQENGPPLELMRDIAMCSFKRPSGQGVYYPNKR